VVCRYKRKYLLERLGIKLGCAFARKESQADNWVSCNYFSAIFDCLLPPSPFLSLRRKNGNIGSCAEV